MFFTFLKGSFKDLLPIIIVVAFFQTFFIGAIPDDIQSIALGLFIVAIGLSLFIFGLEIGIFPIGQGLANDFASKNSLFWLLSFGFIIGFTTTIAEPALIAIAQKAQNISSGRIDADILRLVVALSVGCAIMGGIFRIIVGFPLHWVISVGYVLVVVLTFFTPKEIVGLAYDSGGVTTSTVTVPLVAALGIGLANSIENRHPVLDGFGLIALASLTPMIFVQIYGIAVYTFAPLNAETLNVPIATSSAQAFDIKSLLLALAGVLKDIAPIISAIFIFQYVIIRKHVRNLGKIIIGLCMVVFGLYAFIIGLELGLFKLGESMAFALTQSKSALIIYLFGFCIGFSTTMAEPALIAVALKAKEVSGHKINDLYLRIFVAIGVAIGIALGCYRIVVGDYIHYYIIIGYIIVIALTSFAPKYIIPIAYDSGGVTTSTVTVPLVAALGIGLATNIEGRSPLIDGFGLIAFASLLPIITVMLYGVINEYFYKKGGQL